MKAPVYREKDHLPTKDLFDKLYAAVDALESNAPPALLRELRQAVAEAVEASKANVHIIKAGTRVGYAVNKADKAIACDNIMAIVRQIKTSKAW